jgi:hypothetical protein
MRSKDISVGDRLWTNCSGRRVAVEVVRERTVTSISGARRMRKFEVRRLDTGRVLPKARSAQALHPTDGRDGSWPGCMQVQDARPEDCKRYQGTGPTCERCGAQGFALSPGSHVHARTVR